MRKILNWVLPAFLGIVPVLGADETVGEIKNPFFTKNGTVVSIRMAIESGDKVILMVDADQKATTESIRVTADCADDGWEMNDEELTYQHKVIAQVVCGQQLLEQAYTKRKKTPYDILKPTTEINFLNDIALTDAQLPLEKIVEICTQTVYKRPDGKEIEKRGATTNQAIALALLDGKVVKTSELFQILPLGQPVNVVKVVGQEVNIEEVGEGILLAAPTIYQLILKETTVPQPMVSRCYEHKNETSNQGFKVKTTLRHWCEHYNATNVTREIFKILDGQEFLYLTGATETLLRLNGRDSGRTNQPNCPPLGQAFPPNSRVVI